MPVGGDPGDHGDGVLGAHVGGEGAFQCLLEQVPVGEAGQGRQQPDFLLLEGGPLLLFPEGVVGVPVPPLPRQAEYHAPNIGVEVGRVSQEPGEPLFCTFQELRVSIAARLAHHGATQQSVQMAFPWAGLPAHPLGGRVEKVPGEGLEGPVVRLVCQEVIDVP